MLIARPFFLSLRYKKTFKRTSCDLKNQKNLYFGAARGYSVISRVSFTKQTKLRQSRFFAARYRAIFLSTYISCPLLPIFSFDGDRLRFFSTLKKKDSSSTVKRIRATPTPYLAIPKINPKLKVITYMGDLNRKKIVVRDFPDFFLTSAPRSYLQKKKIRFPSSSLPPQHDTKTIVLGPAVESKGRVIFKSTLPFKLHMWQFPKIKFMRVYWKRFKRYVRGQNARQKAARLFKLDRVNKLFKRKYSELKFYRYISKKLEKNSNSLFPLIRQLRANNKGLILRNSKKKNNVKPRYRILRVYDFLRGFLNFSKYPSFKYLIRARKRFSKIPPKRIYGRRGVVIIKKAPQKPRYTIRRSKRTKPLLTINMILKKKKVYRARKEIWSFGSTDSERYINRDFSKDFIDNKKRRFNLFRYDPVTKITTDLAPKKFFFYHLKRDPVFDSFLFEKLISSFSRDGKKEKVRKVFYNIFLSNKSDYSMDTLYYIIDSLRPQYINVPVRAGPRYYYAPIKAAPFRSTLRAIRFFKMAVLSHKDKKSLEEKILFELENIFEFWGYVNPFYHDYVTISENNKYLAHFRKRRVI